MSTQEMGRNLKKKTDKPYLFILNTEHWEKCNETLQIAKWRSN